MAAQLIISKERRQFGRPCKFTKQYVDHKPHEESVEGKSRKKTTADEETAIVLGDNRPVELVPKLHTDQYVQVSKDVASQEVNTVAVDTEPRSTLHLEGGWPKDISHTDAEQTMRFRRKVEKAVTYGRAVERIAADMHTEISQNSAINVYDSFFPEPPPIEYGKAKMRKVKDYGGREQKERPIGTICWSPTNAMKVACGHGVLDFQRSYNLKPEAYVWDLFDVNKPEYTLKGDSPVTRLDYSFKDAQILAGGLHNGQVAIWDLRRSAEPVETSHIDHSHGEAVRGLVYLTAKSGTEFFTTSMDGNVFWWDSRKMREPYSSLELIVDRIGRDKIGATALEYEPTLPTRFLVGTEYGHIINGNRKGKTRAEKLAALYREVTAAIQTVQRNPFVSNTFLSVSGWTCKLWSEEVRDASVLTTGCDDHFVVDGRWSTTRPGVFYISKANGHLDAWDITRQHGKAMATLPVSKSALQCIRVHSTGRLVAAGSRDGILSVVEVSDVLYHLHANEKTEYTHIIEREARREKTLDSFRREQRLKNREEESRRSQRTTSLRSASAHRYSRPSSSTAAPSQDAAGITAEATAEASADRQGGASSPSHGVSSSDAASAADAEATAAAGEPAAGAPPPASVPAQAADTPAEASAEHEAEAEAPPEPGSAEAIAAAKAQADDMRIAAGQAATRARGASDASRAAHKAALNRAVDACEKPDFENLAEEMFYKDAKSGREALIAKKKAREARDRYETQQSKRRLTQEEMEEEEMLRNRERLMHNEY